MNGPETLFLGVLVVPLLAARWRVSLLGLAAQGALLFVISGAHVSTDLHDVVNLVDFVGVRAVLAPALLYRAFLRPDVPARNDVVPPNLFAWLVVVALVLLSFNFADALADGDGRVGVAATALVLGFFVLATQNSVFSQIVGALRIENAIALFELTAPEGHANPVVRVLHVGVIAGAALLYAWYLGALAAAEATETTEPPVTP